ncbi:MAG: hypothetical protein WBC92_01270 [Terracidiphilus sp.]
MKGLERIVPGVGILVLLFVLVVAPTAQSKAQSASISPGSMTRIGTVDERFQSYNIEAVEVTGGRFWKPYSQPEGSAKTNAGGGGPAIPGGLSQSLFEYRPPLDLSNARLRKLAAALGPAYVRVSGTWMNSTFFQDSDDPAPATPPKGFNSVMTRKQWKGVVEFARAANARIVTSFAVSAGTRDDAGVWTTEEAGKLVAYTKSVGGNIAAAEFMNEPTFAEIGGAPKGYDAQAYARDFAVFQKFARADVPGMIILGPGGVGEGTAMVPPNMHALPTAEILAATGPVFDVFTYHSYGAVSSRCGGMGSALNTTPEAALSVDWLGRSASAEEYYAAIRDRFEPGKPIWNTETGQAACGGDKWASTFLDSFRYLNQLGSLARHGVQVQMHNTLNASDYGLLDETTYEPRPNYWAALLWRRLMGTTVLDPGPAPAANVHVYAQCLRGKKGGVALLVINADRAESQTMTIPIAATRYTLTSEKLLDEHVKLNGVELQLGDGDALPVLDGAHVAAGQVEFAPASITFLAFPGAHNAGCR